MSEEIWSVGKSKPVLAALALPLVGLAAAVVVAGGVVMYRRHRSKPPSDMTEREQQEQVSRLENAWR